MPIRLATLRAERRTVDLPVDGEVLHLTYRPSAYTPAVEEEVASKLGDPNRQSGPVVAMLVGLLDAWDLEDDKGKVVPITEAALRALPARFLMDVLSTLTADMGAGAADSPAAD